jgi:hypothetical protein
MDTSSIKLKIATIQLMKAIKLTHGYKTYDNLIVSAVKILNSSEITGEKSKADILLKNDYDLSKRQEQFFKRLGALETKYFKNILNISEIIKESELRITQKIESKEIPKKLTNNESVVKKENEKKIIEPYEIEIERLRKILREDEEKIKILENKFVKKKSMFSSNYEASISEEEYKNLF